MSHERDLIDALTREDKEAQMRTKQTEEGLEITIGSRRKRLPPSLQEPSARDASGYMCDEDWP